MSDMFAKAIGMSSVVTPIAKKEPSPGDAAVLRSNALDSEHDPFENLYETGVATDVKILKPPYNPYQLCRLVQQNNTLGQCVAAMEVNVDGTGYEITKEDGSTPEEDKNIKGIEDFFDEPYPDKSLVGVRRELRRDLESCGNAYIEVLRNQKGEITVMSRLEAKITRMVKLGDPIVVERTMTRNGKEETVRISLRERRYAQIVGQKVVYFKEFGSKQNLDKSTGKFEDSVDAQFEGTEVIHIIADEDVNTPYGVPRWVNQMPSVLGSRKAEEFNLEFFDHGGLPPALVMIQGGQLSKESRDNLTQYLSGKAKHKQRAVMIEAMSTGGDINTAGTMKITVERFGAERQGDSMFENYDARCSERVRGAFRLPPMFLGLSEEYNFATAYTAYMVAEAQVFQPERTEFDSLINVKLMKEIAPDYKFRSLPLSVKDVETQLRAIGIIKDNVEAEGVVTAVNELANLNLTYEEKEEPVMPEMPAPPGTPGTQDKKPKSLEDKQQLEGDKPEKEYDRNGRTRASGVTKMDDGLLEELAEDWVDYISGVSKFEESRINGMQTLVELLSPSVRKLFDSYVSARVVNPRLDPEGVSELVSLAAECGHDHSADA